MQAEPFIIILASYGALMAGEEWRKNNAAVPILVMIGLILNLAFFFAADNIKSAAKEAANFFGYNAFPGK